MDLARFRSDLAESNQISASMIKPDTRPESTQNWRDSNRKIRLDLRVSFGLNFYPPASFRSSLGWAQTRPMDSPSWNCWYFSWTLAINVCEQREFLCESYEDSKLLTSSVGCSLFTWERTKAVFGVWVCVRVFSSHCCNLHSYSENLFCHLPWT